MKSTYWELFWGNLSRKFTAAPRGRKDLLLIGNLSDLSDRAWGLPPGPGKLGDL